MGLTIAETGIARGTLQDKCELSFEASMGDV